MKMKVTEIVKTIGEKKRGTKKDRIRINTRKNKMRILPDSELPFHDSMTTALLKEVEEN